MLVIHRSNLPIVAASIFFTLVCITDHLCGKIPNLLNGSLAVAGFGLSIYAKGYTGIVFSITGLALGLVLLLLPFLAGGFGAGDVKALGALGALLGPADLLHVFVYMAFFGGGLALLFNLFNAESRRSLRDLGQSIKTSALTRDIHSLGSGSSDQPRKFVRFPYATAIAFGYYTFITWGGVL